MQLNAEQVNLVERLRSAKVTCSFEGCHDQGRASAIRTLAALTTAGTPLPNDDTLLRARRWLTQQEEG